MKVENVKNLNVICTFIKQKTPMSAYIYLNPKKYM